MDGFCATCDRGRHSPSGKVCCALINDHKMLGVPCSAPEESVIAAMNMIIPAGQPIYQGWAYPNRRYGDEMGDRTVMSGLMVNEMFLLDPEACCSRYEPRKDPVH